MRFARLVAALVLAAAFVSPASATTVVRLTAEQAGELARRIVEARVVAAHDVQVPGTEMTAVEYELAVERVIKDDGSVASQLALRNGILIIRQVGSLDPAQSFSRIVGMPEYRVGARYRLSLNGESAKGLTSPVGFGQGVQRLPDAVPAATAVAP